MQRSANRKTIFQLTSYELIAYAAIVFVLMCLIFVGGVTFVLGDPDLEAITAFAAASFGSLAGLVLMIAFKKK